MPTTDTVPMTVGDSADIKIQFTSARGHTVRAENIVLTVDDPTVLQLTVDPDNPVHCTVVGLVDGSGKLTLDADGHIGDGVSPIHAELPFVIAAEDAVAAAFNVNITPAPAT